MGELDGFDVGGQQAPSLDLNSGHDPFTLNPAQVETPAAAAEQTAPRVSRDYQTAYSDFTQDPMNRVLGYIKNAHLTYQEAAKNAYDDWQHKSVVPSILSSINANREQEIKAQQTVDEIHQKLSQPVPTMPTTVNPNLAESVAALFGGLIGGGRGSMEGNNAAMSLAQNRQQREFENAMRQFSANRENALIDWKQSLADRDYYRALGVSLQDRLWATQQNEADRGFSVGMDAAKSGLEGNMAAANTLNEWGRMYAGEDVQKDLLSFKDKIDQAAEGRDTDRKLGLAAFEGVLNARSPEEVDQYAPILGRLKLDPQEFNKLISRAKTVAAKRQELQKAQMAIEMYKASGGAKSVPDALAILKAQQDGYEVPDWLLQQAHGMVQAGGVLPTPSGTIGTPGGLLAPVNPGGLTVTPTQPAQGAPNPRAATGVNGPDMGAGAWHGLKSTAQTHYGALRGLIERKNADSANDPRDASGALIDNPAAAKRMWGNEATTGYKNWQKWYESRKKLDADIREARARFDAALNPRERTSRAGLAMSILDRIKALRAKGGAKTDAQKIEKDMRERFKLTTGFELDDDRIKADIARIKRG